MIRLPIAALAMGAVLLLAACSGGPNLDPLGLFDGGDSSSAPPLDPGPAPAPSYSPPPVDPPTYAPPGAPGYGDGTYVPPSYDPYGGTTYPDPAYPDPAYPDPAYPQPAPSGEACGAGGRACG